MELNSRKKNARLMGALGLALALIGFGLAMAGPNTLRAWGIILSVGGFVLVVRGLYRFLTKAQQPSSLVSDGQSVAVSEPPRRHIPNPKVSVGVFIISICLIGVGIFALTARLSGDAAATMSGHILFYGTVSVMILGGILKLARAPYAWEWALGIVSLLFMTGALALSGAATQSESQDQKIDLAFRSMVGKMAGNQPLEERQYPESEYGRFGSLLTAMNHDLSQIQDRKLQFAATQAGVGSLGLGSAETFTDPAKRSEALQKIATLRTVNSGVMQLEQEQFDAIHRDVEGSALTADEKQKFLNGFDKTAKQELQTMTDYFKVKLQIDDVAEDMLRAATADGPRLVSGKAMFNDSSIRERVQGDTSKLNVLSDQLKKLQAIIQGGVPHP